MWASKDMLLGLPVGQFSQVGLLGSCTATRSKSVQSRQPYITCDEIGRGITQLQTTTINAVLNLQTMNLWKHLSEKHLRADIGARAKGQVESRTAHNSRWVCDTLTRMDSWFTRRGSALIWKALIFRFLMIWGRYERQNWHGKFSKFWIGTATGFAW